MIPKKLIVTTQTVYIPNVGPMIRESYLDPDVLDMSIVRYQNPTMPIMPTKA